MKRRKNTPATKEEFIQLRCTTQQKTQLKEVAAREGLGLGTWLLHVGLLAAQERQREARR